MAVYVDDFKGYHRNMMVCYMTADTLDELRNMASELGLKPEWELTPPDHPVTRFPISMSRRRQAIAYGAILVEHGFEPWRCRRCLRGTGIEGLRPPECKCQLDRPVGKFKPLNKD